MSKPDQTTQNLQQQVSSAGAGVRKYQVIRDQLRDDIRSGRYAPGDQLPTERELVELFGVTRMTVRQAITGLVRAGLVVNRRPQGNFVREHLPQGRGDRHVNLICIGGESSHAEIFIEHGVDAARKRDLRTRVVRIYPGSEHMAVEVIQGPDPSIVVGSSGTNGHDLPQAIRDAADRVVLLGVRMDHAGVRSIVGDDELGLRLAVDRLHRAGHERIGLVGSIIADNHPTLELQVQYWRQAMMDQGLASGTMDKHIIRLGRVTAGGVAMSAFHAVQAYYQRQRIRATALIALSEEAALGTVAGLSRLGVDVPADASVIAYAGTCRAELCIPPLTTIDVDVDQHLETAMQWIDQQTHHDETDNPDTPASPDAPADTPASETTPSAASMATAAAHDAAALLTVVPPTLVERQSVGEKSK